ncbi:hypothetical protein XENOCAPTIV_005127 [Xenoophorus captivus]|uniref:Uncharacterized protein n=1 Tax=Xenoophorus captivus TaxID=1517983 RepID=A0ABV0QL93_9TELE
MENMTLGPDGRCTRSTFYDRAIWLASISTVFKKCCPHVYISCFMKHKKLDMLKSLNLSYASVFQLTCSCSLLSSSRSSCSSVRDTREPLSSLLCRGILECSRMRGSWMVEPLSSSWIPLSPSKL